VAAVIPLAASVVATVLATRASTRAANAEIEADRLRDLEQRIDARKYDTYKPMIELLRDIISSATPAAGVRAPSEQETVRRLAEFGTWVSIYGSDDAVRAFRNFMQGVYHDPPPEITMRLYYDFVLAARRDMGHTRTEITALDLMGQRLKDVYDLRSAYVTGGIPFADLAREHNWTPPWERVPTDG
jgi:hypothetical protein